MVRHAALMLLALGSLTDLSAATPERVPVPVATPEFEVSQSTVRPAHPRPDASAAFQLEARVLPRSTDLSGLELQARVQPKGAALDCNPDTIFRNGFESP
jgi:hypothetical protein